MAELSEVVLTWVLTTLACFWIIVRDERALPPELAARAWPSVSRDAAIIAFGQIAVLVHFWKTRRWGLRGFGLGVLWTVAATLPALAADFALSLVFPELG